MLAEHSLVVLLHDVPEAALHEGDVGTIVHVYGQGAAYEVEFVDGGGATLALLTLAPHELRSIGGGELLHARRCGGADEGAPPNAP